MKIRRSITILGLFSLLSFFVGCTSISREVAATVTQLPTNTLSPTSTSTSTPTATFTSSPTPDSAATEFALATQTTSDRLKSMEKDLKMVGYPETGYLAWYQTLPISVIPAVSQKMEYELVDENLVVADFIFKTDITWSATSLQFCGFDFRAETDLENGKKYNFIFMRFSGLPAWEIDYYENGEFVKAITDRSHFSRALITDNNATNEFILVAKGNEFTVYINKVRQGTFFDYGNELSAGQFALLALQDSGQSVCTYSHSWIWVFD